VKERHSKRPERRNDLTRSPGGNSRKGKIQPPENEETAKPTRKNFEKGRVDGGPRSGKSSLK